MAKSIHPESLKVRFLNGPLKGRREKVPADATRHIHFWNDNELIHFVVYRPLHGASPLDWVCTAHRSIPIEPDELERDFPFHSVSFPEKLG